MPAPTVRPLLPADVAAADAAAWAGMQTMYPPEFMPADLELRARRGQARIGHIRDTDPGGAWVAEVGEQVVGVALAILREGLWGLSLLAVRPELHGAGTGRALLGAALDYGRGARGGLILSSTHAAAQRSYFRAGFALLPCTSLSGVVNRNRLPGQLRSRPGDPEADRDVLDACARHVRSAAYGSDIETMIAAGRTLLVFEDRGFAVHDAGSPSLLCALDEEAARDLLASCLAATSPGAHAHVDFVTAGHDWVVEIGLEAGLSLTPDGPVFVRGEVGPLRPFLPSGAYL